MTEKKLTLQEWKQAIENAGRIADPDKREYVLRTFTALREEQYPFDFPPVGQHTVRLAAHG